MRSLIVLMFGGLIGWTASVCYFLTHRDVASERIAAERDEARKEAFQLRLDVHAALDRLTHANATIDSMRREWMRSREQWWIPAAAEVPAPADMIPAPKEPFPTKP